MSNDEREASSKFVLALGADGTGHFVAILEEDQRGPKLDAKRTAEPSPGAVFDFDVSDGRELFESYRDGRRGGLAVAAPAGTEFENDGAFGRIDFFSRRAGIEIIGRHDASFCFYSRRDGAQRQTGCPYRSGIEAIAHSGEIRDGLIVNAQCSAHPSKRTLSEF